MEPGGRRDRWAAAALAAGLVAGMIISGPTAHGSVSRQTAGAGDPPLSRPNEASARVVAVSTGRRVEVSGLRSETGQVFANPTGTFTLEQYVRPVRVNRNGAWVPVDTTLHRDGGGAVMPAAVALDLAFSGGGSDPLVRMAHAGKELALSWPRPLPAPVLDGDVATYPEVLPGVDLVLRADVEGYSETLVVKSAAAAVNPALATLRFGMQTRNLTVRQDAGGNLDLVDGSGASVFHGPAPSMWDSSGVVTDRRELLTGPGLGAKHRVTAMSVEPGGVVLTPDRSMLTDPHTRWPVFIDPFATGTRAAWTSVWKAHPNTSYYNSSDIARVGHEDQTGMTNRSFFAMDTSGVRGKHILKGTFRAYETWAWSCNAQPVQLWLTGGINSSTTWNNQPSWISKLDTATVAKGYSSSCPAGGVDFTATSAVVQAAASGWTRLTLGLRASDETDTFEWKKFKNNPSLEIEYNTAPAVPSQTTTDPGLPCVTGSSRPAIGTSTATFRAKVTDSDAQNVGARFEWWRPGGSTPVGSKVTAKVASGTIHSTTTGTLTAGTYSWRVRAEDGIDVSAWHSWCEFTVDLTAPQQPPTVISTTYPETKAGDEPTFGGGVGVPGTFTFAPGTGDTDVKAYRYGLNVFPPSTQVAASGTGATAAVSITPTIDWLNRLYVRSVDAAGNLGPIRGYEFYVVSPPRLPGIPISTWQGLPGPYYNIDELITVSDYTPMSQQRWSYRFDFYSTGETGSLGLEVDGEARSAFFQVEGAREALATTPGASCTAFSGAFGQTCRLSYDWVPGRTYRLRVWVLELEGSYQWWGAWVQDTETDEDTFIGKVRMNHLQRLVGPVSLAEYTGPDLGVCGFLPQSKALMNRITANAGTVTATGVTNTIEGGLGCPGAARIANGPVGSVMEIGEVPLYTSCEDHPQTYLANPGSTATSGTKVVEISAWRTDENAPAQIWSVNTSSGNTNQRWTPQCQPDGTWVFVNLNSGKCLTEPSAGLGVDLVQQTCTYGDNQKWWHDYRGLDADGRDYWALVGKLDLRCIDIQGPTWANGTVVHAWNCYGGWSQRYWFQATGA